MLDEIDILNWLDQTEPVNTTVKPSNTNTLTSHNETGMCFEVSREVLLALLEKVMPVVPTRDIIPVLTNIEVTISQDELKIVSSSTDMSIVTQTSQVEIIREGTQLIPARIFASVIRETFANSKVYIEVTAVGLVVVSESYTAEIALPKYTGFPKLESVQDIQFHEIDKSQFTDAINLVKYALPGKEYSGQDSMKMISIRGSKFTTCDGSRFQQARIPGFKLNMQLPSEKISQLLKFLASFDMEKILIGELPKKLVFNLGSSTLYLNKIDSPYPNVEQLWLRPALTNDQELLVNKNELLTAIKQVKIASDSNDKAISLSIDDNVITVTCKDSKSSGISRIACVWKGKPRVIVVNYIHLAEMLKSYTQKECRFLLGEDSKGFKSPILIKDDNAMATLSQMMNLQGSLDSYRLNM